MKRFLFAALLPILIFSCAKEENTNEQFRTPTCEDTTDDGRFEAFTTSETQAFLKFYENVPMQEADHILALKMVTGRTIFNTGIDYEPRFIYRPLIAPLTVHMYLPYGSNKFYSWQHTSTDTVTIVQQNLYNIRPLQLTPGCYRLYYVFASSDTGTVYTKGHYDIQIRN